MIVDTSVLIAILRDEPEASLFEAAMEACDGPLRLSAASYLEAAIVTDGMGLPSISVRLDDVIAQIGLIITPVTENHARIARRAYERFGKGSKSPARLNFGDCFSYALAFETGEPLLFKGQDFSHTDIEAVT